MILETLLATKAVGWLREWGLLVLAVAIGAIALYATGHSHGKQGERARWLEWQAQQDAYVAKRLAERNEATQQITEDRAESREVIRTVTNTILKEVPVYVPRDSCDLPPGYRLLHDAAAAGVPPPPAGTDAAPVPAQAAVATVIDNYGTCHDNADRLAKLQQWVREVTPP